MTDGRVIMARRTMAWETGFGSLVRTIGVAAPHGTSFSHNLCVVYT